MGYRQVFYAIFIVVFGIPIKFLSVVHYFLFTNRGDFREGMEQLYWSSYSLSSNAVIEILNGKIYLNCYTLGKLIRNLDLGHLNDQQIFSVIWGLKIMSAGFIRHESKDLYEKFYLGDFVKLDGKMVKGHYLKSEGDVLIHPTSNVNFRLDSNQIKEISMPGLVKENAPNPGTIITVGFKEVIELEKYKVVSKHIVNSIKFAHKETFNIKKDDYRYMYNKDADIRIFLSTNLRGGVYSDVILKELRTNCYAQTLFNLSENDLIVGIKEYRDEIN